MICELPIVYSGQGRWLHEADGWDDFDPPHFAAPADTPHPSAAPAQPVHTARAAAGGHPGTLDGPGVLGRALLDTNGVVWRQCGDDDWRCSGFGAGGRRQTRAYVEDEGPATEVLLVDPAAGPLIQAVHGWRAAWTSARRDENADRLDMALIDAVDAYDRPTRTWSEAELTVARAASAVQRPGEGAWLNAGTFTDYWQQVARAVIEAQRQSSTSDLTELPDWERELLEKQAQERQADEQQPTPLVRVRWIPLDSIRAAVEELGFYFQDVREVRIGLHDVTVSHNQRHEGKLTGVIITQTVPIDRRPADA